MKITKTTAYEYSLQMKKPLATGAGQIKERRGVLLHVSGDVSGDASGGIADCAKISGTGTYAPLDTSEDMQKLKAEIHNGAEILKGLSPIEILRDKGQMSELEAGFETKAFVALEMAVRDMAAQAQNISFAETFESFPSDKMPGKDGPLPRVPLSEPTCMPACFLADSGVSPSQLEKARRQGFGTVKIKLSGQKDLSEELAVLRDAALYCRQNNMSLRLDLNRSLKAKNLESILKRIHDICGSSLEYLEEPIGDIDNLLQLAESSPVPLAADESLREEGGFEKIQNNPNIKTLVVKPTQFKSLAKLFEACRKTKSPEKNKTIIVSSSIDGAFGLSASAHFASALYADLKTSGTPTTFAAPAAPAVGLDTAKLLKKDLVNHKFTHVNQGEAVITPPRAPGLGLKFDPKNKLLQRFH